MSDTVSIVLMGGLGNQLFQIFTLISYSIDNNKLFEINDHTKNMGISRSDYWTNFLSSLSIYVVSSDNWRNNRIYMEKSHEYTPIKNIPISFTLFGYFQTFKYFEHNLQSIKHIINYKDNYSYVANKYFSSYIPIDKTSISIHFRVGDYKDKQDHHPVMKLNYYIDSLKYIFKDNFRTNNHILLFFEEQDYDYVMNNFIIPIKHFEFPGGLNITFQNIDHNIPDWEQMILMSKCKHNIIANSSFSWWGAYLNENEGKKICYPEKWFGPKLSEKNTNDMFPPSWNKIPC